MHTKMVLVAVKTYRFDLTAFFASGIFDVALSQAVFSTLLRSRGEFNDMRYALYKFTFYLLTYFS